MSDEPEQGKVYCLIGGEQPAISNGNTWAESEVQESAIVYRATATASGWYKNGRYLSTAREGAIMRPETLAGYGNSEREARMALMRKVVARNMALVTNPTIELDI